MALSGQIRIGCFNAAGLNDRKKRQVFSIYLRYLKLDYTCVQETHLPYSERHLMREMGARGIISSLQSGRTKGVAILFGQGLGGVGPNPVIKQTMGGDGLFY